MAKNLQSSFEGYLEIDNRDSPGITAEQAPHQVGMRPVIPQVANKRLQMVTKKCGHCPKVIVLNPQRVRDRGYCPKHDGFICDECHTNYKLTGVCRPWNQQIDDYMDKTAKGQPVRVSPRGIILP